MTLMTPPPLDVTELFLFLSLINSIAINHFILFLLLLFFFFILRFFGWKIARVLTYVFDFVVLHEAATAAATAGAAAGATAGAG